MGNDGSKSQQRDKSQNDTKHAIFLSDYRKPLHDALLSVLKNPDFASLILDFLNPIYLFLQTPMLELHCTYCRDAQKIILLFNTDESQQKKKNNLIPFNYYNYNVAASQEQNEGSIIQLNNVLIWIGSQRQYNMQQQIQRNKFVKLEKVYLQNRLLNMRQSGVIGTTKKGNFKLTDYITIRFDKSQENGVKHKKIPSEFRLPCFVIMDWLENETDDNSGLTSQFTHISPHSGNMTFQLKL